MFKKILVFAKNDPLSRSLASQIAEKLKATFVSEAAIKRRFQADLIIVIGGDGTVIRAERLFPSVPKFTFGSGRLGFLSSLKAQDWEAGIKAFTTQKFILEERLKLSSPSCPAALNEYLIKGTEGKMFKAEVWIDKKPMGGIRGDGILVSTPTGSTAYALSCGGPIVYPTAKNISLIPVNPFQLGSRPIVLADTATIQIQLMTPGRLFADGEFLKTVDPKKTVTFKKAKNTARFVLLPQSSNFFEKLSLLR